MTLVWELPIGLADTVRESRRQTELSLVSCDRLKSDFKERDTVDYTTTPLQSIVVESTRNLNILHNIKVVFSSIKPWKHITSNTIEHI